MHYVWIRRDGGGCPSGRERWQRVEHQRATWLAVLLAVGHCTHDTDLGEAVAWGGNGGLLELFVERGSTTHDGVKAGKVHIWSQDEEGVADLVIVLGETTELDFCTAARASAISLGGQIVEHPVDV